MSEKDESGTPITFSKEETSRIREAFAKHSENLICPRCGGAMSAGGPVAGGGTIAPVHEIRCDACAASVLSSAGR